MKQILITAILLIVSNILFANNENANSNNSERIVLAAGGSKRGYRSVDIVISNSGNVRITCRGVGNEACALVMDNGNSDLDHLFGVAFGKITEGVNRGRLTLNNKTVVWRAVDENNFQIWDINNN